MKKEFKPKDLKENPVARDHCHLTGRFRGLAHNNCNLNTRRAHTSFVPILFHNFSGYDCHLIFEKVINMATEKNIKINENDIIAKSSESYISVKIGCLKFLDSYRFLDASLDKLSQTNNSVIIDQEIVAIVDKLLEYKCISKKQYKQILLKCNLLQK